jgi:hypothetical protein
METYVDRFLPFARSTDPAFDLRAALAATPIARFGSTNTRQAQFAFLGATSLPGHHLLVADRLEPARFDADGERQEVFTACEPLLTPPVVIARGEVLVASAFFFYWLRANRYS